MFVPGRIEIETEGAFVPVSEINRIRREALAAREEKRAEDFAPAMSELREAPEARLPDVCEEATLEMIRDAAEKHRETLGGVVLGTAGQLGIRWPVPFGAGSGIPVMNRQAAALLLEEGCEFVTASPELTGRSWRCCAPEMRPLR